MTTYCGRSQDRRLRRLDPCPRRTRPARLCGTPRGATEPVPGEPCRNADPNHPGVCHQLPESNYENNVSEILITIPDHPGRKGVGPLKDQPAITPAEEIG